MILFSLIQVYIYDKTWEITVTLAVSNPEYNKYHHNSHNDL